MPSSGALSRLGPSSSEQTPNKALHTDRGGFIGFEDSQSHQPPRQVNFFVLSPRIVWAAR